MRRQRELEAKYEAQWDAGKGSHHPDYDPAATGDDVVSRSRLRRFARRSRTHAAADARVSLARTHLADARESATPPARAPA